MVRESTAVTTPIPIRLIMITSNPDVASFAIDNGVDWIMVDLEFIGKNERQGHLDTLISCHKVEDVEKVAKAIKADRLIVRTNPLHDGIQAEIDSVLEFGPKYLMLPMVRQSDDVVEYIRLIQGRAGVIPLIETASSMNDVEAISGLSEVTELYIGLNDLHLDLNMKFIFEPIAEGMIDSTAELIRKNKKSFGFGGIARMDEGAVPGRLVLAEHIRLGSSMVILSRTFHRRQADDSSLSSNNEFIQEIRKLRQMERKLQQITPDELAYLHKKVCKLVALVG